MPELPEVETTCQGLIPHVVNQKISHIKVRQRQLRWPVSSRLAQQAQAQTISQLYRRAKYLIFDVGNHHMIIHLGMSGSLRIARADEEVRKHDHIEWQLSNNKVLRFHDPRRFGSVHWTKLPPNEHKLLKKLGPEPLESDFNADYLYECSRNRTVAIKNLIMNAHIVVGVGNIYASESLFLAGIHPNKAANKISYLRYQRLVSAIKEVLSHAIQAGGTTLRDFINGNGNPGYFKQQLRVYERADEPCTICNSTIESMVIGQRNTYYCRKCQK